jgi:hypothetical protein
MAWQARALLVSASSLPIVPKEEIHISPSRTIFSLIDLEVRHNMHPIEMKKIFPTKICALRIMPPVLAVRHNYLSQLQLGYFNGLCSGAS